MTVSYGSGEVEGGGRGEGRRGGGRVPEKEDDEEWKIKNGRFIWRCLVGVGGTLVDTTPFVRMVMGLTPALAGT